MNAQLTERFGRNIKGPRHTNGSGFEPSLHVPKSVLNPAIAQYVQRQDRLVADAEEGTWLSLPELPKPSEICLEPGTKIALPPNRIGKPWPKTEKYVRAHYMLLREDSLTTLREAVSKFKQDPYRMDDHEVHIYEQVRTVGLTFTSKGVAARIRFSTIRAGKRISWASNRRLTSGTLVALTPTDDAFQTTCAMAIVAARPLANLEVDPPEIDIFLTDPDTIDLDAQRTYYMIEAMSGYFEAYRHTLRALQMQHNETFPLADHICRLQPDTGLPEYVVKKPVRDLSAAADEDHKDLFSNVDLTRPWPPAPTRGLDATQWAALKEILTRKLSIVQGPPGTGKTYVSQIALEILFRNRADDDPPIIIACQTNHALDQLLGRVKAFDPLFIRLGGRSTTPEIKRRSLYAIKQEESRPDPKGSCFSKARREFDVEKMRIMDAIKPLLQDDPTPLSAEVLAQLGVISQQQYQSLEKGAAEWVTSEGTIQEPLQKWIGTALAPFRAVYKDDSFGFEEAEEDLEIEQVRERDAENGLADDEDIEMLRGDFWALSMGMTMPEPSPNTIDQAKKMLDTATDLYKAPPYLRGPIYLIMQRKATQLMTVALRDSAKRFDRIAKQIQIGRWEKDITFLQEAKIIGMTTTGLSKYRALVSALKPKIVLIEEAAEVLEGPVAVACVESLEHLILVGDHQQLQANCSVKELEGLPYQLNISMFERLVRGKMPHRTLLQQRRMDPDFRTLINPIYLELRDHESVIRRPIQHWGMKETRSFFFTHERYELQDEQMSTYNDFEALMVAKFYRHLIRNDVPAAAITILTFYNGQRKKILRELKSDPETASAYNKVKTVDSYQGEENIIVILSLVRSNQHGRIGFLDINNRVTVALSRARFGFYIFGNAGFLSQHNEMWYHVEETMHKQGRIGARLPLICTNHGQKVHIKYPEEFDLLNGGCPRPCEGILECKHPCPHKCHVYPHSRVRCEQRCTKVLVCGHKCSKECYDMCECDCEAFQQELKVAQVFDSNAAFQETQEEWVDLRQQNDDNNDSYATIAARWNTYASDEFKDTALIDDVASNLQQVNQSYTPHRVIATSSQTLSNDRTRYTETYQPGDHSPQALTQNLQHLNITANQAPLTPSYSSAASARGGTNDSTRGSHGQNINKKNKGKGMAKA